MKLSDRRNVESSSGRVVEWQFWSFRVVEWRSCGVVELSNGEVAELTNRRVVEWGKCRVVESSNGTLVVLSDRRMVEW